MEGPQRESMLSFAGQVSHRTSEVGINGRRGFIRRA